MKEPPVVHAIENQKSRDDIAADMSPTIPGFPTPPTSQPDRKMTVQLQSQQVDHSQAAAAVEGQEVMLGVFDAQKVASVRTAVDADGLAGKRKRVLRAASDLAPGSCVDTESLRSPIASFDGGSQQGDICMKEPPVVHAIENQKSRDDIAANMRPSGTADPPAMERPAFEQKLPKPCVDQAETQCWFGSKDCLPQQTPQRRSNSTAETELEASQASQSQDAGASQQRDTQDAVDAQIAQEQLVPAEPSEPSGEPASEPAGESLVGQGLGGQADAISPMLHPPVRKSHLKHRLVGKQTVRNDSSQRPACCLRSGSNVSRARIGHTLDPPERGFLVRVQGDGWGGSGGSYLATVTESDAETFTVIRRGDCYGSWDETHVLKTCCSIVARTTSKEHVFLSVDKGREGRTSKT